MIMQTIRSMNRAYGVCTRLYFTRLHPCRHYAVTCSSSLTTKKCVELMKSKCHYIQCRTFFMNQKTLPMIYKSDGIDIKENDMVFNSQYDNYILMGQVTVIGTALCATAFITGYLCGYLPLNVESIVSKFESGIMLGCFAVSNTLLVSLVVRKCLMRVYYNETNKLFTLVFPTFLPWTREIVVCKSGDVTEKDSNMSSLLFGDFYLGKRRFIMVEHHFRSPVHFNMLLGYLKPSDSENEIKE